MTKKRPRFGAIPKVNMPRKSHETPKPQPRARQSRPVIIEEMQQTNQHCYKSLVEFSQRLKRIKSLSQWNTKTLEDKVVLKKMVDPYLLPKTEIIVDDSLSFTVKVYGCFLPEDHPVYVKYRRSVRNISILIIRNEPCFPSVSKRYY